MHETEASGEAEGTVPMRSTSGDLRPTDQRHDGTRGLQGDSSFAVCDLGVRSHASDALRAAIAMFLILGSWALKPLYMAAIGTIVAGRTLALIGGLGLSGLRSRVMWHLDRHARAARQYARERGALRGRTRAPVG
jgi:hypothetical protein